MVAIVKTVVFQGIEALPIEVQVQIASGLPSFAIVGLPDKAVGESRERVRTALSSIGLASPQKRSPLIFLQQTFKKKEVILTFPLPLDCSLTL